MDQNIVIKSILFVTFYCFVMNFSMFPQDKEVILVEKKLPKRTILFAKNTTNSDKNIFLKINPVGYRRSSSRPLIKTIPAQSEVEMIILIPLKDTISSYTYTLIINDQPNAVTLEHSQVEKKQASVAPMMENDIVIFTKKGCEKCTNLIILLHEKHIKFREINIDTRNRFYDYFWQRLEADGYDKNTIIAPVMVIKGKLRYPITDIKGIVKELSNN